MRRNVEDYRPRPWYGHIWAQRSECTDLLPVWLRLDAARARVVSEEALEADLSMLSHAAQSQTLLPSEPTGGHGIANSCLNSSDNEPAADGRPAARGGAAAAASVVGLILFVGVGFAAGILLRNSCTMLARRPA